MPFCLCLYIKGTMRTLLVFIPTSFSLSRIFTFEKWEILFLMPSSNRYLEDVSVQGGRKRGLRRDWGRWQLKILKNTCTNINTYDTPVHITKQLRQPNIFLHIQDIQITVLISKIHLESNRFQAFCLPQSHGQSELNKFIVENNLSKMIKY